MPDFFIVGHAKCGTTALYEMLREHPQIFMPKFKEPWYFSRHNPQDVPASRRTVAVTGNKPMSQEEYLTLFADALPGQRTGEASTSYLWSETAAAAIAAAQPAARIIAILREPASFLRSLHLQLLVNLSETETDLRRAIALEDARRQGREIPRYAFWPQSLIYSDRVRYVEQLQRYHAVFPPEQVLVLIYDDFRADNEGTVRRVLRFLGVDDTGPIELVQANPSVSVRSLRADDAVRRLYAGRGPVRRAVRTMLKTLLPHGAAGSIARALRRGIVYGSPPQVQEDFELELRRRYKAEVVALSEYLGRDLVSQWGYDALD
jgi:hypothetical protein